MGLPGGGLVPVPRRPCHQHPPKTKNYSPTFPTSSRESLGCTTLTLSLSHRPTSLTGPNHPLKTPQNSCYNTSIKKPSRNPASEGASTSRASEEEWSRLSD